MTEKPHSLGYPWADGNPTYPTITVTGMRLTIAQVLDELARKLPECATVEECTALVTGEAERWATTP